MLYKNIMIVNDTCRVISEWRHNLVCHLWSLIINNAHTCIKHAPREHLYCTGITRDDHHMAIVICFSMSQCRKFHLCRISCHQISCELQVAMLLVSSASAINTVSAASVASCYFLPALQLVMPVLLLLSLLLTLSVLIVLPAVNFCQCFS
jgi:hypothetical protein